MEERRQFVRLDTRLDLYYTRLPSTDEQRTVTKNISGGGICLIAGEDLQPGDQLQIAMKLPDRETPVHFIGQVVWSEPYEVIGRTQRQRAAEIGIKFVEISPQDRETVMRYVILSLQPRRGS